jgi:hypothetical protein
MNITSQRYIHTQSGQAEAAELLQALLVAEYAAPGERVWLVSPFIGDLPVIDNRDDRFLDLEPAWAGTWVRLSRVLTGLARQGTDVRVVTTEDGARDFLVRLRAVCAEVGVDIPVVTSHGLHQKLLLGDAFALSGSMNFTWSGVHRNLEGVRLDVDPATVAENHVHVASRWGGGKQ